MYAEFLSALLDYVSALNAADKRIQENGAAEGLTPYLGAVAVLLEDGLCGFLVDEVGGAWSYRDATAADREWWDKRPWASTKGGR